MADIDDLESSNAAPPVTRIPWGPIFVAAIFLGLGILAFWIMREKKSQKAREATVAALDQELGADEQAVKAQRAKVDDLTKRVEELRTRIQVGDVKDGKAAVAEFNKMAAEQRAERDKFIQMAEQYNQKVAKFHQLEE